VPRLDTSKGQTLIEPFVAPADAVFADNRSCLFDPAGEKDPVAWEPALRWLLALRRRGKGVMMGHHTARHGGARGHSKPEDPLNLILTLTRPADWAPTDGARFDIAFAKSRGIHDAAIVPFRVRLTGSGWVVMPGAGIGSKLLEHVQVNWDAGEPVTSANKAVTAVKVNRQAGLKTWGELLKEGRLEKVPKKGFRVC
jgi:hypothetical protein